MDSVYVPIPISTITKAAEKPSLTYRLDLESGRIVGRVDKLEAVKQAIRKALITPRFKCLIYNNQYGSEIEEAVIAKDASREYVRAVIEGFIKDALLPDKRILSISNVELSFEADHVQISFQADTIFGQTAVAEVI